MIRLPSGISTRSTSRDDLVRVVGELQHMRQQHQVQAVAVERQFGADQTHVVAGLVARGKTQRDAAVAQKLMFRQPQLHRVETEDIAHRVVEVVLLARQHIAALLAGEPFTQTLRG